MLLACPCHIIIRTPIAACSTSPKDVSQALEMCSSTTATTPSRQLTWLRDITNGAPFPLFSSLGSLSKLNIILLFSDLKGVLQAVKIISLGNEQVCPFDRSTILLG